MTVYLAFVRTYAILAFRDRQLLVFTYLMPAALFALLSRANGSTGNYAALLVMAVAVGAINNGLQGAAQQAVAQREAGLLRRFQVTCISPTPIVVAAMVSGMPIYLPSVLALAIVSRWLYHVPSPTAWVALIVVACLANLAFRAIGIVIGAVATSQSEASVVTQGLYLPMLLMSGATIPVNQLPAWAQHAATALPATYAVKGIRAVVAGTFTWGDAVTLFSVTGVTIVVGIIAARLSFRWNSKDRLPRLSKLALVAVLLPPVVAAMW